MADTDKADATPDAAQGLQEPVLAWYNRVYSRRVDLIGDYSGVELFAIEGDSLLLHCFSDKLIDFDRLQLLHATWAVEQLLRGLVSRRCNFHLVFFDQHRELCIPPSSRPENREKYLLARAAIVRHLRVNLRSLHPNIEVSIFSSVTSDAFASYVQATDFFFFALHDGAEPGVSDKSSLAGKELDPQENGERDEPKDRLRMKITYRQLIYWFMTQNYSIVLINGLEFQDTKAVATVLENFRRPEMDITLALDNITDGIDEPRPKYLERSTFEAFNSETRLTERQYITAIILSALLAGKLISKEFADAILRHSALVSELRLSHRLVGPVDIEEQDEESLEEFCVEANSLLSSESWAINMSEWGCGRCDVADLIDGRLLAMCARNPSAGVNQAYYSLLKTMKGFSGVGVPGGLDQTYASQQLDQSGQLPSKQQSGDAYAVLPFSNSAFETHLSPVHLNVARAEDVADAMSLNIFREVTHWHNSKRPLDPKLREDQILQNQKQLLKARRRNQFFMAEMTTYAASLTNAVGKSLEPEIITSGAKTEKKEDSSKPKMNPKTAPKANPKSGKKGGSSKKEEMLAKIKEDKSRKDEASSETWLQAWRSTCLTLEKEPTAVARYQKAKQYLVSLNTDLKRNALEAEVQLYMLNILLSIWIAACRNDKKEQNQNITALIYDTLSTFSKFRRPITKTIANCLEKTMKDLSLPKLPLPKPEGDRGLAFKFALADVSSVSLSVPLPSKDFQLLHCGPYFDRSMDSAPDARVPFEPDAWQRKVLDEIDAKRSLLVIAPTSAGKTFISFYAMRQVLDSNDDDILVYVAPTKALVNQIAAEVQARFSKTYKYAGNSVWGIHTRDYRINNPTGCQILVTVPHILQIMLMAPTNASSWSKRIKWIIFDEVHCIGQAEDGLIWEQLLLMAPCPILALSATIGNPEEFSSWLNSTQQAVGNELTMVQHPHRYSDLRKFVFQPTKITKFQGLSENRVFFKLGLDGVEGFTFLHPVASLVNRSRGLPSDLSLEARDCLALWQSMAKHQTKEFPIENALDPQIALPSIIRKIDVINWEASIKVVLRKWMADAASPFETVVKDLGKSVQQDLSDYAFDFAATSDSDDEDEEAAPTLEHYAASTLPLLAKLHEQDALPAILFNYDRGLCERICESLMKQLEEAETNWKESSPKWKNDLKKWDEWKKIMAKADKRNPPKLSKKKGNTDEEGLTKEDIARDGANNEANPWASFDPEKPIDRFHFADNKRLSRDEMDVYEKELIRREVPEWLLRALRRGIGVHHAGLNRKYRQVCEMLFRRGYLRVVIATGTLALGINMPCKTVIFSGDSIFLTALNYRQAAGRAGRRGFDMLGNVVFHGVRMSKINRLISSRLPDLNGHFPITTTLVLRLFSLLNDSKNSPFAIRSVNSLLSQPRLYLGGEESKMTVLHHLRFSIEYLRRQFLLDSRGVPLNFAGCVSHLYFTENSSFAFHALLKDGYFHKLCAGIEVNPEKILRELILTMAHLFGRQYCRQADQEYVEDVVKRSPSIVFLPRIAEGAATVLREHNRSTLGIYKAYVSTFIEQHLTEPDNSLPLTGLVTGGDDESRFDGFQQRPPTTIRSPFVALSGHDDTFASVHDLCATTRSGVFLEEAVIPYVGLYPEESHMPLNAYLYDFFSHGDVKALANANRIRRGDVWFVLNDFSMILATIVTSLSNYMNISTDADFTDVRGEGEDAEEQQEDKLLPAEDSGYETASTISTASKNPLARDLTVQVKKKKRVADSWDDDADDEETQIEVAELERKQAERLQQLREKPAWEEGTGMLNVLKAFKALKEEFDTKFRAMWA